MFITAEKILMLFEVTGFCHFTVHTDREKTQQFIRAQCHIPLAQSLGGIIVGLKCLTSCSFDLIEMSKWHIFIKFIPSKVVHRFTSVCNIWADFQVDFSLKSAV